MSTINNILISSCSILKINLLATAYEGIGIATKYHELDDTFFRRLLPQYLNKKRKFIFFDVGANVGEITNRILQNFQDVEIHSFEPNPHTFEKLIKNKDPRVIFNNLGLSDTDSSSIIYFYEKDTTTGHASIYKNVFDLHGSSELGESSIRLVKLDDYCKRNEIEHIDFLKIDTEGNDYFVLKGSIEMLNNARIDIIQFEFNEMNIISRVFLRDFYDLLNKYKLYRIKGDKLFPLGDYSPSNEIFKLQNILAIREGLYHS